MSDKESAIGDKGGTHVDVVEPKAEWDGNHRDENDATGTVRALKSRHIQLLCETTPEDEWLTWPRYRSSDRNWSLHRLSA